uniref:Uncharacterized protein n=1 Tax=Peromyscus maniculatus bairdii TaxID=230844 RepID=A0A8C8UH65_PERMB
LIYGSGGEGRWEIEQECCGCSTCCSRVTLARGMTDIGDCTTLTKLYDKVMASLNHALKSGGICETSDKPKTHLEETLPKLPETVESR